GVAVSISPHTVVVDDQIRCGALPRNGRAPTLDTITVRHDRDHPFDPSAITGALLVWGPDTLLRETRTGATRYAYEYFAYLINGTDVERDLVATVTSRSPDIQILDGTVTGRVPSMRRLATLDGFAFQHDRSQPYDPDTLEWQLRFGTTDRDADLDRDGDVDADDLARLDDCLGRDPARECACAAADLDGDGAVDGADRALAAAQLGRSGLPVPPLDETPPEVVVIAPAPGSDSGPPPAAVPGTVDAPLCRRRAAARVERAGAAAGRRAGARGARDRPGLQRARAGGAARRGRGPPAARRPALRARAGGRRPGAARGGRRARRRRRGRRRAVRG